MAIKINKSKTFKDLPIITKGLIIGGGALITYFALKKMFGSNVQKAPVNYGQIPVIHTTSGGQQISWNPDNLAKEISTNLEGYNFNVYPETTNKILPLNQDQTSLLYNHYNTYYAQDYPTLTKLIESEWGDWSGSYAKAVSHLKSFGLNENSKGGQALWKSGHFRKR